MTVFELQDSLVKELEHILKDLQHPVKNTKRSNDVDERREYKVFPQELPIITEKSEEHFPYVIVKVMDGRIPGTEPIQEVDTLLLIGSYDKSLDRQGHRLILNVINKIIERFRKDPMLNHKFMAKPEMEWSIQDENTHPLYIGGIKITWETRTFKKEDPYS